MRQVSLASVAWTRKADRGPGVARSLQREHLPALLRLGSGREDDGSSGVAASYLGERPGGIGERVAGGDRNLQPAVGELRCEFAQLVSGILVM
jgi:hypothetical protein